LISGTAAFSSRYAPQNASYVCVYAVVNGLNQCASGGADTPGRFEEDGWFVLNGQLAWTDPSDHLTLSVFAENLTNTRYKIISSATAYGSYEAYNQPRSIGGRVAFRF
jgi:iron complex outermembrane receptor protein